MVDGTVVFIEKIQVFELNYVSSDHPNPCLITYLTIKNDSFP